MFASIPHEVSHWHSPSRRQWTITKYQLWTKTVTSAEGKHAFNGIAKWSPIGKLAAMSCRTAKNNIMVLAARMIMIRVTCSVVFAY